jgi:hypothetical protein
MSRQEYLWTFSTEQMSHCPREGDSGLYGLPNGDDQYWNWLRVSVGKDRSGRDRRRESRNGNKMYCWPEDRRTKDLATHPEEKEAKRVDMCPYTRTLPERTLDVYSLAAQGSHRCSPSLMAHANLAAET